MEIRHGIYDCKVLTIYSLFGLDTLSTLATYCIERLFYGFWLELDFMPGEIGCIDGRFFKQSSWNFENIWLWD
jgi:hypothetical protein